MDFLALSMKLCLEFFYGSSELRWGGIHPKRSKKEGVCNALQVNKEKEADLGHLSLDLDLDKALLTTVDNKGQLSVRNLYHVKTRCAKSSKTLDLGT